MSNTQPILVIIRGLPGSGKTYLTDELQKVLEYPHIVLDPDATDYESEAYKKHTKALGEEGVEEKLHPYRFLRAQAWQAIDEGKVILWNQPWTNREAFRNVVARMKEYAGNHDKELTFVIVEVELDKKTAKKRVEDRKSTGGHGPSDDTFARFVNDYETFGDEGFETIQVNGADDVKQSVEAVTKLIAHYR